MTREQYEIQYDITLGRAYFLYKKDWCKVRNYPYEEVVEADKEDKEYNGQMFVCKSEFEGAEFLDEGYMRFLLNDEDYWCYEKVVDYFKNN